MKKFYETPAVEFTGFSVEDVITTSTGIAPIDTANMTVDEKAAFEAAVVTGGYDKVIDYGSGSYEW